MKEKYKTDDIKSLDEGTHVRMRPKMYFEKCFIEQSLNSIAFEVLCHAFDEYLDGNCSQIKLRFCKDSFTTEYNVGMSLKNTKHKSISYAEIIMTKIMACSNLKKHLSVGETFCHLGLATINYASEYCELTTVSENQKGFFRFEKGELIKKSIEPFESEANWTKIDIKPDPTLFENLFFTSDGIYSKAEEIKTKMNKLDFLIEDNMK